MTRGFQSSAVIDDVKVNGPATVSEICDRLQPGSGISRRRLRDIVYGTRKAGKLVPVGTRATARGVAKVYGIPGQTAEQWHFAEFRTSVYETLKAAGRPMTPPELCEAVLGTREVRELERVRSALYDLSKCGLVKRRRWFGNTSIYEAVR